MKRVIALVMAVLMLGVLFVGCSQNNDKPATITGPNDLYGAKIGVQEATTGDIYVRENFTVAPEGVDDFVPAQVFPFKSGVNAALDLSNGMVDAVVIDALPAQRLVAQHTDLMILDQELTVEEYGIAIRKEDTELLANINAAIAAMKADGTYDALLAKYMPEDGSAPVVEAVDFGDSDEVLVMGTNAEFAPFEYKNEFGNIVGFDVEMAAYIARFMGKRLVIEDMNFDATLFALKTGTVDIVVAGMTATEERKLEVNFSDSYFSASQVIIVKK